jgi:cysteine desulfurase/selenocysteine lyase
MNKIIYLDAAASALKPLSVIEAETDFLKNRYANAGRGICPRATAVDGMVDFARNRVARFINAPNADNIVFTNGTTDGMNRIARIIDVPLYGYSIEKKTVMVSDLDHHSARLPFEVLWDTRKCSIVLCPLDDGYNLNASEMPRADVFVITAMSNVIGRAQDVKKLVAAAKALNPDVITIVDAAQYVAHLPIDVTEWDCDFLCFSAHKIGADTGLGILYMKNPARWVCPDKFGGGMIAKRKGSAAAGNYTLGWDRAPAKFEAGTLPLTQIAGLAPAIDYLAANRADKGLIKYLHGELSKINGLTVLTKPDAALLTFYVEGMHCLDFGALIGAHNVCLRVGNMCATWIHERLGCKGSIRISTGPWNTMDEMVRVVGIIKKIIDQK